MSIWQTILNPITLDHITGAKELPTIAPSPDESNDDMYYMNRPDTDRKDTPTYAMKLFHNKWIKSKLLIDRFKGRADSLFDPTCGQGGDLFKWMHAEIPRVLGTDLFKQNIYAPKHGANERLAQARGNNKFKNGYRYVFLPYDFRNSLRSPRLQHVEKMQNQDAMLLEAVWGKTRVDTPMLAEYNGMAIPKFQIVSCQFALHYFFEKRETFDTFVDNLDYALQSGGYFLGTCFDGVTVNDRLARTKMIQGTKKNKENADEVIWQIEKKYDSYDATSVQDRDIFGKKITVYIESIGKHIDEYLVSFDYLVKRLEEKGIRLLTALEYGDLGLVTSHGTFEEQYNKMYQYVQKNERRRDKEIQDLTHAVNFLSNEEKRLSFMYRWFIFRKQ